MAMVKCIRLNKRRKKEKGTMLKKKKNTVPYKKQTQKANATKITCLPLF